MHKDFTTFVYNYLQNKYPIFGYEYRGQFPVNRDQHACFIFPTLFAELNNNKGGSLCKK